MQTLNPGWLSVRNSLRGPIGWLVLLNVIVFGFLLARILAWLLFGAPLSLLLLDGLNDQISRLEIIAAGPCGSTGMQQFQRGEIGPILNVPGGAASLPPARIITTAPEAPDSRNAAPTAPSQELSPTTSPPGPTGQMLPPEALRSLVQRSVVFLSAGDFTGTGFAISPNMIVTNRHVIEHVDADEIGMLLQQGLRLQEVAGGIVAAFAQADHEAALVRGRAAARRPVQPPAHRFPDRA